jgi:hypothetical protein
MTDRSLFGVVKRGLYPATAMLVARARVVEGPLKKHGTPFRCLIVDNAQFGDYLLQRLYDEPPAVVARKRVWIPALRRLLRRHSPSCDLLVAVLPKAYDGMVRGLYDYRATENVRQVIDTSGSWDDVRKRLSKTKRQISNNFEEKHGLAHRMSTAPEDFDFFYRRMFVPHIQRKFGSLASIDAYEEMKRFFQQGMLLFVTKDGRDAAGALCVVKDDVLEFRRTGVLDGDDSHISGGGQTALYYFQLRFANGQGLRAVDTMLSASFLNDGVYLHKREWGATVLPDDEARAWVYLFNARPSEAIARFFESNPMIVDGPNGLEGVVGAPGPDREHGQGLDDLVRRYQANGLRDFRVVTETQVVEKR